ncbi:hypothetical protein [Halocalculus aciditolerans]|uniref:Uncharacterized protein n=1 Tax=Halocalculus aciditolerans TaxID=1383812 RepID=A0A830FGN2_9EURY|nr:hypothetical protein [Halocalculus aciditolerans]GGL73661.1 hypothetical protein GCM10009039_34700 [Halocalculus aciditolerans]
MKRGTLGIPIDGTRLDEVESQIHTSREAGHDVRIGVDVSEQHDLRGDAICFEGRVLRERVEEVESAVVTESGGIRIGAKVEKTQQWADVSGAEATDRHDGFVLVDSSDGQFALDIVGRPVMEPARLRLGEFLGAHDVYSVTTAGMNTLGPVDTVTSHGSDVRQDTEVGIGELYESNLRAEALSQARFTLQSERFGPVRGYAASSGYIEVYGDMETAEFVRFIEDDVIPHAGTEEDL